jgi:hypothetical protein
VNQWRCDSWKVVFFDGKPFELVVGVWEGENPYHWLEEFV